MMKVGRRLAATPTAATAAWEPTDTAWTQATHKYDGSEPESNGLSAKAVLEAAAARVGRGQPGAATAGAADDLGALSAWLAQRGVLHGWQLEHLERADWEAAGATLGLRSAVRAALLPSTEAAGGARTDVAEQRLTRFQQRFLLQPDPRAARSLGGVLLSWDAAFLGTMLVVLAMGNL